MVKITAPGKATQQHCEWLRPRGLKDCITQIPPAVKLIHLKVVAGGQYDGVIGCCCGP